MNLTPRGRANLILLLTSVIWGFAFVAQRAGMAHVGPFTFNGVRFLIGGLALLPLIAVLDRGRRGRGEAVVPLGSRSLLVGGALAGAFLFGGAALQQMGIQSTTAGKAGFITGLYVVLVPILGLFIGQRTSAGTWIGAGLAAIGLYFLTMQGDLTIQRGDLLVLMGAFIWAGHVQLLGRLSPGTDPIKLAAVQFFACAALSLAAAFAVESVVWADIAAGWAPILYTGLMSVGVGYTLQVVGQRHARPADAAIILSLEAVFAVIGGWLFLNEQLGLRGLVGCGMMLAGILVSQLFGQPRPVHDPAAA
jgi:drug/metabolite transporter (DMT)-like permease